MSTYTVDPKTGQMYYVQSQEFSNTQVPVAAPSSSLLGLDMGSSAFWKGALLGAGIALAVTNETVQKAVVKAVSKGVAAASAGVEEFKEKFEDARAEVEAEAAGK